MSQTGWVKLSRKLLDHWLWDDKPFSRGQAWIDLIFSANHQDEKVLFNGKKTEIKRGSRITSIRKLSEKWGWSKDKVRRFLDELEADGMVTQKRDTHSTLITMVKYDFYQSSGRQTGQQRDANRNQTGNRREQTKNDKRMIKEGEEKPTLFEISQFAAERKLSVKPERFFEYYEKRDWRTAQGNPVADWKELLLEWERTEYQKPGEKKTGYAGIRNLAEEW